MNGALCGLYCFMVNTDEKATSDLSSLRSVKMIVPENGR